MTNQFLNETNRNMVSERIGLSMVHGIFFYNDRRALIAVRARFDRGYDFYWDFVILMEMESAEILLVTVAYTQLPTWYVFFGGCRENHQITPLTPGRAMGTVQTRDHVPGS